MIFFFFSVFKSLSWSLALNTVSVVRADITKQAWWFIQPKFSFSRIGSQKSKIKVSAQLASPEASCFALQMATFSLCAHRALPLCPSLLLFYVFKSTPLMGCQLDQIRAHPTASFQFNHLSGPYPQILSHSVVLGVRVFTYQLGQGGPNSVHNRQFHDNVTLYESVLVYLT